MTGPFIIFFRGLNGLIDENAATRLAKNRGCEAVFYHYNEWADAAADGLILAKDATAGFADPRFTTPKPGAGAPPLPTHDKRVATFLSARGN
jgi:hypothetical protein